MSEYRSGCECKDENFRAESRMDGGQRLLKVTGSCTCQQGGYSLLLIQDTEGATNDPGEIRLRLMINRPPFGADGVTETAVPEREMAISAEAKSVVISMLGRAEPISLAITGA